MSPELQAKLRSLQEVYDLMEAELKSINSQILQIRNQNYTSPREEQHHDYLLRRKRELLKRLAVTGE